MYQINEQKCLGCQACVRTCPEAIKIGKDGKAAIIDQKKLEQCGGESICPMGAIKKIDGEQAKESPETKKNTNVNQRIGLARQVGFGSGRKMGAGRKMGYGNRRRVGRRGKRI
jgi:ferredoxin